MIVKKTEFEQQRGKSICSVKREISVINLKIFDNS